MRCVRRVEKLESRLSSAFSIDPLRAARSEAFDRLAHSDRKIISELARKYHFGEYVENTPEIRECLARWGDLTAALGNQPPGAQGWNEVGAL